MVTLDVEEMNLGSEMSDLLIDLFLYVGIAPGFWKPCVVGVLAPEPAGEGCTKAGVALTTNGAVGDGLGARPISGVARPLASIIGDFCPSKYPGAARLLLLRDLLLEPSMGDGIGDCENPIPGVPGDLGAKRAEGTSSSS